MNLPNKITVSRFFMTMLFVALAIAPADYEHHLLFWRASYFTAFLAGITDWLDGYLARKYNLVTNFGKLMDPLADKIHTVSAFVVLTEYGVVPGWITILILTREFAVTGLRVMAAKEGIVIAAAPIGKLKTGAQFIVLAVGGLIWVDWLPQSLWGRVLWGQVVIWDVILYGVVILTVYTGFDYFHKGRALYLGDV